MKRFLIGSRIGIFIGIILGIVLSTSAVFAVNFLWVGSAKMNIIQVNSGAIKVFDTGEYNHEATALEWDDIRQGSHAQSTLYVKNVLNNPVKVAMMVEGAQDFATVSITPMVNQSSGVEKDGIYLVLDKDEVGVFNIDLAVKSNATLGQKNFSVKLYEQ